MKSSAHARWVAFSVLVGIVASASVAQSDRDHDEGDGECDQGHDNGRWFGFGDWPMYNHDARGTRNNTVEHHIGASNVASLHTRWSVPTAAAVSGTPVVADGRVFVGDWSGAFYSIDEDSGAVAWQTHLAGPISGSATLLENRVVVGTVSGFIYGLNRHNGHIDWTLNPGAADGDRYPAVYGSGTRIGRFVAIGIASSEEQYAPDEACTGCRDRGRVVLIDAESGHVAWSTPTVTDAERAGGAAGAGVWSSPSYSEELGLVYVTTGNNYTATTSSMEDAFIAIDVRTGAIRWANQRTADDSWNWRYPFTDPAHPGSDFADSPQVYRLASGQLVVGAGEKNGFYFVVDASNGSLVQQTQLQPGGPLGGLFADSAYADGVVYANGSDFPDGWTPGMAPHAGYLTAVSADASHVLWQFQVPGSADLSGVAVANGVVYFASLQASTLFALDTSGHELARIVLPNGAVSGPAIAHGRVYIGTGDPLAATPGPGSIVSLGL